MKINPVQEIEEEVNNTSVIYSKANVISLIKKAQSKKESENEIKIRPISEIKQTIIRTEKLNDSNLYSGVPSPSNDKKKRKQLNLQRPKQSAL